MMMMMLRSQKLAGPPAGDGGGEPLPLAMWTEQQVHDMTQGCGFEKTARAVIPPLPGPTSEFVGENSPFSQTRVITRLCMTGPGWTPLSVAPKIAPCR